MLKNTAGQKVGIFAYDIENDEGKTGDAANITAYISKDGGAASQSNDVNPTELDVTNMPGVYVFDLTQAETNCETLMLYAKSSTSYIKIEPVRVQTDAVSAAVAALNNISASDIVTAIKAMTGITEGGTWTFAKLLKVLAAWAMGNARDKTGVPGTQEILDPDDGAAVIAEVILSETSPQRQITIKI